MPEMKLIRKNDAQALMEFAIAMPILLVLFFGCMGLIHLAVGHILVRMAVHEAGHQAYMDNDSTAKAEAAAIRICSGISSGDTLFGIKNDSQGQKSYFVSHRIKLFFPFLPNREITYLVPAFLFESGE